MLLLLRSLRAREGCKQSMHAASRSSYTASWNRQVRPCVVFPTSCHRPERYFRARKSRRNSRKHIRDTIFMQIPVLSPDRPSCICSPATCRHDYRYKTRNAGHVLSTFGETPKRANTKNDGIPFFVWDRSASRRVRRLRPKTRLAGAGEALSYPTRRPWAGDDP